MQKRPGCLSMWGLLAALLTLTVVTAVSLVRGNAMFSAGDLNAQPGQAAIGGVFTHADIEPCAACHPAFWEQDDMSTRCLSCHSHLLVDTQDFHAAMLAQAQRYKCQSCHSDHNGAQASLTRFDTHEFPHNMPEGYSLLGHQRRQDGEPFACQDCHGLELDTFDPGSCLECHAGLDAVYLDGHTALFGEGCLDCHDGIDTYGEQFDHDQSGFVLQDAHAGLECGACHQKSRTRQDLQETSTECYACHAGDDAHDGRFGEKCAACHTPTDWEEATFDHARTDFPLAGKHAGLECEQCHAVEEFTGLSAQCIDCHARDDEHNGEFGTECGACHTPEGWENATFDHSQSAFPLEGAHARVECRECHLEGRFQGIARECAACHLEDDAHAGSLGTDCAACHVPASWQEVTFDHSKAAFALTGAHVQVECQECHLEGIFKGTPQQCAACHADPLYHQGLFGADCAACHDTAAWRPARFDRAHTFPIDHGARGGSACSTCHPGTLRGYTCYGCHDHNQAQVENEHREEGINDFQDCTRCHPTGREEEGGGGDD